jgi:anionic cell wall polymer biosynthesis LytR-Cps2A-Psr (LCP) family protein
VDFQGFMKIIDHVGGVDVDVDCALPDIKLQAGIHHLDGKEALRYARSRKSTSDFDRGRRQRKVLMALWDQALTMDIIPKLPQLWVTMADTFETDLPLEQVINLAYVGTQLKPQHIQSRAINRNHVKSWRTPQGWAVQLPQEDKLRALLESYYEPTDPNPLDTAEKTSVEVSNGSQRHQADELAAAALRWEGFKVSSSGPVERQNQAKTKVLVHNGDLAAGKQIADRLRLPADAVENATGPSNPADIQVILGQDYNPCQR